MTGRRALLALTAAMLLSGPALAHGFLVKLKAEGAAIVGQVYYTDGTAGAGEFVELRDLTDPRQPVRSGATDAGGGFRFDGAPGHRYALIAHGEEGHETEMQITLGSGENGRLVDTAAAESVMTWPPPAWALIGGALLVSMLIPLGLRRRNRPRT